MALLYSWHDKIVTGPILHWFCIDDHSYYGSKSANIEIMFWRQHSSSLHSFPLTFFPAFLWHCSLGLPWMGWYENIFPPYKPPKLLVITSNLNIMMNKQYKKPLIYHLGERERKTDRGGGGREGGENMVIRIDYQVEFNEIH